MRRSDKMGDPADMVMIFEVAGFVATRSRGDVGISEFFETRDAAFTFIKDNLPGMYDVYKDDEEFESGNPSWPAVIRVDVFDVTMPISTAVANLCHHLSGSTLIDGQEGRIWRRQRWIIRDHER